MTPQEAYRFFTKKHKGLIVTECIDYSPTHYIFVAVADLENFDFSDPYYAVDKRSGLVTYFTPMEDLDKWFEACEKRSANWK